jgi:hypothetical protein
MTVSERMPAHCETTMLEMWDIGVVGQYVHPQRVSDATLAKYKAWFAAGQPRLAPDDEDDEPDHGQGG